MTVPPLSTHCILELHGCDCQLLNDETFVRHALTDASRQGMSTLLKLVSHQFDPQGVTALALLAESHMSIHTWPENGYAAIDVFTCGRSANPQAAVVFLTERFIAAEHSLRTLTRGVGEPVSCPVPS